MRIDYIFSSAGGPLVPYAAAVDRTAEGSDHFPLIVDFVLSTGGAEVGGRLVAGM
jgi:endonuclease/exonuclease/phosphatase (EEP) superfamily protein YafD